MKTTTIHIEATKITDIKLFSEYQISKLEKQINNYLKKRRTKISVIKRDISFHNTNIPGLQISICYNNEDIERHGIPEQVKNFNNFVVGGTSRSENIEKDVQNFISSKEGVIDVLFLTHTDKHVTLRVIAVFYLDHQEN